MLPDYSGDWSGQFLITGCTGGRDFRECGRLMDGGTGVGGRAPYPFSMTLSQFRDQVTGTVREPRPSGDLTYAVGGIVRLNGQLVLEATVPQQSNEPLRVFNWASTTNAGVTTMAGAFTKIEPRRTVFGEPTRSEQRTNSTICLTRNSGPGVLVDREDTPRLPSNRPRISAIWG